MMQNSPKTFILAGILIVLCEGILTKKIQWKEIQLITYGGLNAQ